MQYPSLAFLSLGHWTGGLIDEQGDVASNLIMCMGSAVTTA